MCDLCDSLSPEHDWRFSAVPSSSVSVFSLHAHWPQWSLCRKVVELLHRVSLHLRERKMFCDKFFEPPRLPVRLFVCRVFQDTGDGATHVFLRVVIETVSALSENDVQQCFLLDI
jgi:hypothetical protein